MKKYIFLTVSAVLSLIQLSCISVSHPDTPVVNQETVLEMATEAVKSQLVKNEEQRLHQEISFWQKKLQDSDQGFLFSTRLAECYSSLFELTGEIHYLELSDQFHRHTLAGVRNHEKTPALLGLSANAMKRHDFDGALSYCQKASGQDKENYGIILTSFDAEMELGNYAIARYIIEHYANPASFDYLVRYAKWQDHDGDLEGAIGTMENALSMVKNINPQRYIWALSMLAEMYGHDGQIDRSYDFFMNVLEQDPSNIHALKGIAWIAFAHDDSPGFSKRLLHMAYAIKPVPDLLLALAEIAEHEQDLNLAKEYQQQYLELLERNGSHDLYASTTIDVLIDMGRADKAVSLASKEYEKRPTTEIASLLAWAYFHFGDPETAVAMVKEKILGQSHEPATLYRSGVILRETGNEPQGRLTLVEASNAQFELGPVVHDDILRRLKSKDFLVYR